MTATLLSGASALLRTVWQACFLAMPVASATRSPTALRRVCWRARPSRHGSTRLNCRSPRSLAAYSPRYPISRESPCATSASTTSNPSPCSGSASTPLGELLLIQSLQITSHAIPDRPASRPAAGPSLAAPGQRSAADTGGRRQQFHQGARLPVGQSLRAVAARCAAAADVRAGVAVAGARAGGRRRSRPGGAGAIARANRRRPAPLDRNHAACADAAPGGAACAFGRCHRLGRATRRADRAGRAVGRHPLGLGRLPPARTAAHARGGATAGAAADGCVVGTATGGWAARAAAGGWAAGAAVGGCAAVDRCAAAGQPPPGGGGG